MPQLEEDLKEYLDNPHIGIINVLHDSPYNDPKTCVDWGSHGDERMSMIINDYDYFNIFRIWFDLPEWNMPHFIFIDENFEYYTTTQSEGQIISILEEMLENLEEN